MTTLVSIVTFNSAGSPPLTNYPPLFNGFGGQWSYVNDGTDFDGNSTPWCLHTSLTGYFVCLVGGSDTITDFASMHVGTWETLGVPPGAVVNQVTGRMRGKLQSYSEYNNFEINYHAIAVSIGPSPVPQVGGTFNTGNLIPGSDFACPLVVTQGPVDGWSTSWFTVGPPVDLGPYAPNAASGDPVYLTFMHVGDLHQYQSSLCPNTEITPGMDWDFRIDTLELTIQYTPPVIPPVGDCPAVPCSGGYITFDINPHSGNPIVYTLSDTWFSIVSAPISGPGQVRIYISSNAGGSPRTGTIGVNSFAFSLSQLADC